MLPDSTIDLALAKVATGTRVSYCSSEPATFADIATLSLANATLSPGDGNGDFIIAAGDVSGRKLMLAEQTNMTPTADGTITSMVIDDGTNILATNPVTPQAVLTSQVWTAPGVKIVEIEDPTYA